VRWVCWQETLHGVSKLALREGASVTLDPILTYDGFAGETLRDVSNPTLRLEAGHKTHLWDYISFLLETRDITQ